ncbi:MAG: type II toxin-antitoxin system prevent-host-death family antitoxin [Bifidobacteriaceae bacterium]|jgi:antitoxin YefM|nr:type II toxin-antitoxin system prevent-host-death family antitoxin [Bifidobacteriaceae bacterium]
MSSTTMSASAARAALFSLIDQVNDTREPVTIRSRRGDAVLVSAEEYGGLAETAHLLASPANAARLIESMAAVDAGEYHEHDRSSV